MWASLLLSLFYAVFLWVSSWFTKNKNFDWLNRHRGPAVSLRAVSIAAALSITFFGGLTWLVISGRSLNHLQSLYSGAYLAGLTVTFMLLLPRPNLGQRIAISLILAIGTIALGWFMGINFLESVIMVSALFWVGPAFMSLMRLPLWGHAVALAVAMIIDIYNIWFPHGISTLPSDQHLNYNGIIAVNHYSLGIGDFFIGAWAISLLVGRVHPRFVWLAILVISMARWIWRLGEWSNNIVLPYTIVIVPTVVIILLRHKIDWRSAQSKTTP